MIFKEFRGVTLTDYWKTSPNMDLIPRCLKITKKVLIKFSWMSFPEIDLAHAQEIEISKKYWMGSPEIGLCNSPENLNFG